MNDNGDFVWVVIETSAITDTTVGVFSTLEKARDAVAAFDRDRLADFRIEGHAVDSDRRDAVPWQVSLSRAGDVLTTDLFVGCNCGDDEAEYYKRSFIARDGESMSVIVFALTPGQAIRAANEYRTGLQEAGYWQDGFVPLEPIQAPVGEVTSNR